MFCAAVFRMAQFSNSALYSCGSRSAEHIKEIAMRRSAVTKILSALLVLGLAIPAAAAVSIPAPTRAVVRCNVSMNSANARVGQVWDGTLVKNVVVNGQTLFPAGTSVRGKVTNAKSSGRLHASGVLSVRLTTIGGTRISSSARTYRGKSHTKSNVTKIGGGTAAGALIGGLAGGGKGALIGAGVGAGAGTGVAAATGKQEAHIPAETVMSFTVYTANSSYARLKKH
jgi:hypothetical protein